MGNIFVNFTNHRSEFWKEKQIAAAKKYGDVVDLPFPDVDPFCTRDEIERLGEKYYRIIMSYHPDAVLCQGEFTLAVNVILRLKADNIPVLAACSERISSEDNGIKTSRFEFAQFREYI